MDFINIAIIGKFLPDNQLKLIKNERLFVYNEMTYELFMDIDQIQFKRDLQKVPAFSALHIEQNENIAFLHLIFRPSLLLNEESPAFKKTYLLALKRMIETFFDTSRKNIFDHDDDDEGNEDGSGEIHMNNHISDVVRNENTASVLSQAGFEPDENVEPTKVSIDQLYQGLREAHIEYDNFSVDACDIKHPDLKPQLTDYQVDAVRWMLERETRDDFFPTEFIEVQRRWPVKNDGHKFYYNERTTDFGMVKGYDIKLPSGGILAEQMGLGKTVEILTLILLNKRELPVADDDDALVEPEVKRFKFDGGSGRGSSAGLKCLCIKKSTKRLIQCTKCNRFQHQRCVLKHSTGVITEENYICPECWQHEEQLPSAATFVVSPASIKMQWFVEIQKHIGNGSVKVLVYDGIQNSGWISPAELATYDIVLTDYNVMRSELNFSAANKMDRNLRSAPRSIKPVSPLHFVEWWRVCLDEAQMAESINSRCALMIQQLPACHRWAVTGTPIQRSINDLYGLLHFLNCDPYSNRIKWHSLMTEFTENSNAAPMIAVLKKIMWRTCKTEQIMRQIKIPPQTEIMHKIMLSDLEKFFYDEEHALCLKAFEEKVRRLDRKMLMSTMTPHILKLIMEPLRKLRYDCTVPRIFERDRRATNECMKPDQLLKYLVKNNENKTKSELRTIGSSLNGLAALYIIKGKTELAIKMYNSVLRYSSDYTGAICVDTLLQVHALHNLLLVNTTLTPDKRNDYESELHKLEWKHIHKNATLIQSLKRDQQKYAMDIDELKNKFFGTEYSWWADVLNTEDDSDESQLFRKIVSETNDLYDHMTINCKTLRGVAMLLTIWMDRINEERKNVQEAFDKLKFFVDNMRPAPELSDSTKQNIERLVTSAFQCHLDKTAEQKPENKRKKQMFCLMCKVKNILETYECVIFDKKFVQHKIKMDTEVTEGSWKPAYQEFMLKIIHAHSKNKHFYEEVQEDGKVHLQYLDTIKKEYKEYSQLWVEINFTLSAYDEIKMCKSRLRAVDPEELEDETEKQSKLNISKYEVDDTILEQTNQLHMAELEFVKKKGTLRYLEHLEANKEVEDCPICQQKPEEKFAVLECGHHMCVICYHRWTNTQSVRLKCFICRHEQHRNKIYHVTLQKSERLTNASTKIEEILQTIVKLRNEDGSVKIIIFSHWTTILKIIEDELKLQDISFRSKLTKFHLTINEFKDPDLNVTCLLLPLKYGSKGLNLIEATHVFLVEPILNPGEELQAVGRVHRMGQTKPTFVHRFIVRDTIEENIYQTISNDKTGKWSSKECTVENLLDLFEMKKIDDIVTDDSVVSI